MSELKQPGRPRDAEIDNKILNATLELLTSLSFEAVTIEAVAAAAGVSRPAIYRRFKNKTELVLSVSDYVFNEMSPAVRPAKGAMDEVLALLENTVAQLTKTPAGALFRNLVPYLEKEDGFGQHANEIGAKRRARLKGAVRKAMDEGAIDHTDADIWIDRVLGAIYFRYLISGRTLDKRYIKALVQ